MPSDGAKQPIRMLNDRVLVQLPQTEGERRSRSGILIPATAEVGQDQGGVGEAPGEVRHLPPVRGELPRQVLGAALRAGVSQDAPLPW